MTVVPLPAPSPAWLALLRAAVERDTIQAVADRIGLSRSTLSLLLAGKYPARSLDNVEQKVRDALDHWRCPHLEIDLPGYRCVAWRTRPMPRSSARELRHWRACQTCPHNPTAKED